MLCIRILGSARSRRFLSSMLRHHVLAQPSLSNKCLIALSTLPALAGFRRMRAGTILLPSLGSHFLVAFTMTDLGLLLERCCAWACSHLRVHISAMLLKSGWRPETYIAYGANHWHHMCSIR